MSCLICSFRVVYVNMQTVLNSNLSHVYETSEGLKQKSLKVVNDEQLERNEHESLKHLSKIASNFVQWYGARLCSLVMWRKFQVIIKKM